MFMLERSVSDNNLSRRHPFPWSGSEIVVIRIAGTIRVQPRGRNCDQIKAQYASSRSDNRPIGEG